MCVCVCVGFSFTASDFLLATGQISAMGEIVVLPLVVIVSFMGQPRLMFSMAEVLQMLAVISILCW